MHFFNVESITELPDLSGYGLVLLASGFERRSTHIASILRKQELKNVVVLGFLKDKELLSRRQNDEYFESVFEKPIICIGEYDVGEIFSILEDAARNVIGPLRVFVDYSVMTRTWYAAILTWARFATRNSEIVIDFAYSAGAYLGEFEPLSISEIVSIEGFEGISGGFRNTTAFYGLGYDKYASLALHDRLEPDSVYCYISQKSLSDQAAAKVLHENETLVDVSNDIIRLPLTDIAVGFRILCDYIGGMDRSSHLVMVPMGPKTHVLMTLLVGLQMPWITCLHAKGRRSDPVQVDASGEVGVARVWFMSESNDIFSVK